MTKSKMEPIQEEDSNVSDTSRISRGFGEMVSISIDKGIPEIAGVSIRKRD